MGLLGLHPESGAVAWTIRFDNFYPTLMESENNGHGLEQSVQEEINANLTEKIFKIIQYEWDTYGDASRNTYAQTAYRYIREKFDEERKRGCPISLNEYMELTGINPENPVQLGILQGAKYAEPNFS